MRFGSERGKRLSQQWFSGGSFVFARKFRLNFVVDGRLPPPSHSDIRAGGLASPSTRLPQERRGHRSARGDSQYQQSRAATK
jgi:hypothetical protein